VNTVDTADVGVHVFRLKVELVDYYTSLPDPRSTPFYDFDFFTVTILCPTPVFVWDPTTLSAASASVITPIEFVVGATPHLEDILFSFAEVCGYSEELVIDTLLAPFSIVTGATGQQLRVDTSLNTHVGLHIITVTA